MKLFPSLVAAPLLYLKEVINALDPYVDGYHIDIMDGHFVPSLTWGPSAVHELTTITKRPLWIHLMVEHPKAIIDQCREKKGSYIFTIHAETLPDWHSIEEIDKTFHSLGLFGIALSPHTPVETIIPYIKQIHHLLFMSVEPGASGQPFLSSTWQKVEEGRFLCLKENPSCLLAIDGGVQKQNIAPLKKMNVQMIAAASALFCPDAYHSFLQGTHTLPTLLEQYISAATLLKELMHAE